MDLINMRSDTQTLPTQEMLEAMAGAELGDDKFDEDPTVQKLERMAAEMMGQEAAMLVISGTMGNLVSLMSLGRTGDEVLVDPQAHVFLYEGGSLANVAGLMPMPVPSHKGMLDPAEVQAAIRPRNLHFPRPRILCLENTHNRSGGRVVPVDLHAELCAVAHRNGLSVHLDGARIFNAAVAAGVPPIEYTRHVDSVTFCLSKGLSCPLGSIVAGSSEFIAQADRNRNRVGGGMRQAGVIAAAGIVALEAMIERLADDHANARLLAEGVNEIPGLSVDMETVETNMVYINISKSGMSAEEAFNRFKAAGVLGGAVPPDRVRLVVNRHHDGGTVEEALRRIRRVVEHARGGAAE